VPDGYWARTAIDYTAGTNDWMRDYPSNPDGTYPFHPLKLERRQLFARSMVLAFAPDASPDPAVHFSDLSNDSPFYRYANIAVDRGWLRTRHGKFLPRSPVQMAWVHRAIVYALGLRSAAEGANHIHAKGGFEFDTRKNFGSILVGMRLGLRYNHSDESLDVNFASSLPRAEVAWSLYRAKTLPSYAISSMQAYATIHLPRMERAMRRVVQWGIDSVGYPYVWGGEWDTKTGAGYCCGSQPIGGFDCSGLTWWLMKHAAAGWDNRPPRPYAGWDLPQRSSRDMASVGNVRWKRRRVGDLMFYDGDGDGVVDHVDTYIGKGWALDSSGTPAGVTIMWIGSGWYRDHFVHARNVIG
jgi:hypothetical protein